MYTNKRSWSPQSSVSPTTFPSVTLVEESGSHNWTAAQIVQEKAENSRRWRPRTMYSLERKTDSLAQVSWVPPFCWLMNSVKKVKKVFTERIPRYYLRSRKVHASIFVRSVRPKQDQETQADDWDEDWEALFAELPFHFLSSPESDTEVEEHINPSASYTYPIPSSSQVPETSRRSIAFCTPTQGAVTDFDPRDISVDSDDESFVCPSSSEEEPRDTHTPRTCPERSYQFSPFYIEHSKEESSDSDIDDKPDQSSNTETP